MPCKSIMYHYVRPEDHSQPHLFYLNVEDFERQLDYFEQAFGVVSQQQWHNFMDDHSKVPEGVVLTFDDGLMDHYQHVYPILKARGYWGIFYVSSDTLQTNQLLNVHRVHYLLGKFGGIDVLRALEATVDKNMFIEGFFEQLKTRPYSMQSMDEHSLRVKEMVNYALNPSVKDAVLGQVFHALAGDENTIAKKFYINTEQIQEMSQNGFLFGAHGKSHNLLTKYSGRALDEEVAGSINALNNILPQPSDTFCYPYGSPDSYNDQVLKKLADRRIRFSFCVSSGDITEQDMDQRPLRLPRYDCNEFPYGQSRIAQ